MSIDQRDSTDMASTLSNFAVSFDLNENTVRKGDFEVMNRYQVVQHDDEDEDK